MNEVISDSEEEVAVPLVNYNNIRGNSPPHSPEMLFETVGLPSEEDGAGIQLPFEQLTDVSPEIRVSPQHPEDDELIQTTKEIPTRSLRKRNANQLRPYTYDTFKYGNIHYSSETAHSSQITSQIPSSQYRDSENSLPEADSLGNGMAQYPTENLSDDIEADSDPGSFQLAQSPPHRSLHLDHNPRIINSSDIESDVEIPGPVQYNATTQRPRKPKFIHVASPQNPLSSSSSSSDSSDTSMSESDSDYSVMEAPVEFDYMTSRRIQDLPREETRGTDFLRVAVRSANRQQKRAWQSKRSPQATAGKARPQRKIIRHERSYQSRISLSTISKEKMTRHVFKKRSMESKKQARMSSPSKNTKERKEGTIKHNYTRIDLEQEAKKPRKEQKDPMKPRKRKKKTLQGVFGFGINSNTSYPSKRPKIVPQVRDAYFTPIIEEEDGTYVFPRRPEPVENIEWEVEVDKPRPKHNNQHTFWPIQPLLKAKLDKSTFVGSNTLTLLNFPEPWNGESAHDPIIERSNISEISEKMDSYCAQLIDDSILDTTFIDMYSYHFQLAAELLRQDTLVDTETRKTILKKSIEIMDRLLDQVDMPPITTSGRLMFAIFVLCVGYSSTQVGFMDEYDQIQNKVFRMLIQYLKPLKHTLRARPPYDRHFVAFELVLALIKLNLWVPLLDSFSGDLELNWQLIFIEACAHDFLSLDSYDGWANVVKLLSPENLDRVNCIDYIHRCILLLKVWRWPPNRDVPHKFFDYFARYKRYEDPHQEAIDIPDHIIMGNFKGELHDTQFYAFLELLGMSLLRFRGSPQILALRNRVTPMSILEYHESDNMDMLKLSGASQRLSIMLVLARTCTADVRLPIEQILGIVKMKNSHITARIRLVHAWGLLVRFIDTSTELESCATWMSKLVHYAAEEYGDATCTRENRDMIDGLGRLFQELYIILLSLPNAASFYSGNMIIPLRYRTTATLTSLAFKVIKQMPLKSLRGAFDTLRAYFDSHQEPMDIWVQVLSRLKIIDTHWPHDSKPRFLVMLMKRLDIPLEQVTNTALEFVARPSWDNDEEQFFAALKSVYGLKYGTDRINIVRGLLSTQGDAARLLGLLQDNLKNWKRDQFERKLYQNICDQIQQACFDRFHGLIKDKSYSVKVQDQVKNSVLGYIENDQQLTLEYFMSHKIIAGLRNKEFGTFANELLPCLIYLDQANKPIGFETVVNRLFREYVWMAIRKVKMQSFISLFAQIALKATNFSDCLHYNPLPFVESLASYIAFLLNSQQRLSDWTAASLLMRLCTACFRQLYTMDDPSSEQHAKWINTLPQFLELAEAIRRYYSGDTIGVSIPMFPHGTAEVTQDFLALGSEPVLEHEGDMQITQAVDLFLESCECFTEKQLLL